MSIAPRFTPSIGNVGSAPIPKAQATSTTAVAFDTLAKVVGNAATVAEKIAVKQDAYDKSVAAHQKNLWDAEQDDGFQKFSSEPLDPQKLDENDYVKDDGVAKHRAALNSPEQQEYFDRLVAPDLIRRKTRIAAHVQKVLQKSSLESTSLQLERQQEIASTNLNNEVVSQVQDLARSRAITAGFTPEVADEHAEKATDDVMYNHIKLVAETRNYHETIARYEKLKGQFGSRELAAQVIVKNAQAEVDSDRILKSATVLDEHGNLDVGKTDAALAKIDSSSFGGRQTEDLVTSKFGAAAIKEHKQRNDYGSAMLSQLDTIGQNAVSTSGLGPVETPIDTRAKMEAFAKEVNLGRMLPEDRMKFIAKMKNPDHSNIEDKIYVSTVLDSAELGNQKSIDQLKTLDLNRRVLNATDMATFSERLNKLRDPANDRELKQTKAISDAIQDKTFPWREMAFTIDHPPGKEDLAELESRRQQIETVRGIMQSQGVSAIEATKMALSKIIDISKGGGISASSSSSNLFSVRQDLTKVYGEEKVDAALAQVPANENEATRWQRVGEILRNALKSSKTAYQDDSPFVPQTGSAWLQAGGGL